MRGSIFYGSKGRTVSGVAGFLGILSAAVSAAQQAKLVDVLPAGFNKWLSLAAAIAIFGTWFNERLQGGASRPDVRLAAERADQKYAREEYTDRGDI